MIQEPAPMPVSPERLIAKVGWRLIPFLGLLYLFSYLDRVNLGFAKLTMNQALNLSEEAYATGFGIFFLGYLPFEIPSNLILERVGARRWMARIMVTWGLVSAAMALTTDVTSFYILRVMLGIAEAGFFPGVILYLTAWFPARSRAKVVAFFMVAVPLSAVIGNPVSGFLIQEMDGLFGWGGWQWMFVLEGVPAVLLGIATWFYLTDRPMEAAWLTEAERRWLEGVLRAEQSQKRARHGDRFLVSLLNLRVWALSLVYFGIVLALYGLGAWLPTIVKGFGLSIVATGWVSALPALLGVILMTVWSRHSDRTGERVLHFALPALIGFGAFGLVGYTDSAVEQFLAICVASATVYMVLPIFWTLPTAFLTGPAAAGGIALINALGNAAGYVGPQIVQSLKGAGGSFGNSLLALGLAMLGSALIVLFIGHDRRSEQGG